MTGHHTPSHHCSRYVDSHTSLSPRFCMAESGSPTPLGISYSVYWRGYQDPRSILPSRSSRRSLESGHILSMPLNTFVSDGSLVKSHTWNWSHLVPFNLARPLPPSANRSPMPTRNSSCRASRRYTSPKSTTRGPALVRSTMMVILVVISPPKRLYWRHSVRLTSCVSASRRKIAGGHRFTSLAYQKRIIELRSNRP